MNCQGALLEPKEAPQPAKSDRLRKRRHRKGNLSSQVNLEMISHDYFTLLLLKNHQARPSWGATVSVSLLKPYVSDLLQPDLPYQEPQSRPPADETWATTAGYGAQLDPQLEGFAGICKGFSTTMKSVVCFH